MPRRYQRAVEATFGDVRRQAFEHLVATRADALASGSTCLDLACGTGLTSLWLASRCPGLRVVGVDDNRAMLKQAGREAKRRGLDEQCTFVHGDVETLTLGELQERVPGWGRADVVTCALGFSVVPRWQEAFENSLRLLAPDGMYVIFDQFSPGLVVHDFAADQSRESWKLVERSFADSETKWFGKQFISIGRGMVAPSATS